MKKHIAIAAAVALLTSFAGCGTQANTAGADTATTAEAEAVQAAGAEAGGEAVTAVEGETGNAAPETTDNNVYAEVTDVISNQLSLKVLRGSFNAEEMAQRMKERANRGSGDGSGSGWSSGSREAATDADGNPVQRGSWGGGNREAATDADGNPVQRGNREPMTDADGNTVSFENMRYTGEEKEVVIPVGTPIVTISFEDGEVVKKESELSDIKNGGSVNIIYDGDSITEVQIVPATGRGRGSAGFGGAGGVSGNAGGGVVIPGAGPSGGDVVINGAPVAGAVGG